MTGSIYKVVFGIVIFLLLIVTILIRTKNKKKEHVFIKILLDVILIIGVFIYFKLNPQASHKLSIIGFSLAIFLFILRWISPYL